MNLIQIVPTLPPNLSGVGDYATIIAFELERRFKINSTFIVPATVNSDVNFETKFPVHRLLSNTPGNFENIVQEIRKGEPIILLHYVGYGYAKRGWAPWVSKSLVRLRGAVPNIKIVIFFHELWAKGAWNTSAFWLSKLQKKVVKSLVVECDHMITSNSEYHDKLNLIGQRENGKQVSCLLPIVSTVGEPENYLQLMDRRPSLVMFGSRPLKRKALARLPEILELLQDTLQIEQILDIGPPSGYPETTMNGVSFEKLGILPAPEISEILSTSLVGLLFYPLSRLWKSSAYAAYCAHGMLPVVLGDSANDEELRLDDDTRHWWSPSLNGRLHSIAAAQSIADNAYDWYKEHNAGVHADLLSKLITDGNL